MSVLMESNSRASSSTSSGVRWAYLLMSVMAMQSLLNVDRAVAGRRRDTGLDSVAGAVFGTGPEVADVTGFQWQHAGLADAHAAAERHLDTHLLAGLQQRRGAVRLGRLVRECKRDRTALAALVGARDDEALHVELLVGHIRVG